MEFFSSWTFIILMAVVLVVLIALAVVVPIIVFLVATKHSPRNKHDRPIDGD